MKSYPRESAGAVMTKEVPIVNASATVGDIEKMLLQKINTFDSINYIYLCDAEQILKGIVSIKELFRSPKDRPALQLSSTDIVTVRPTTDQELVALRALRHNIKALPVVQKDGVFLGAVTSDTILQTLHNENIEDVLRFAGSGKFDNPGHQLANASAKFHFKKRLPWLIVGLSGGLVAAFVVRYFEGIFSEQLALVAFIPAIVYMADAVGSQTQMIFIRSITLEHTLNLRTYIWREVKINTALALALCGAIVAVTLVWIQSLFLSLILGLSILATVLVSMCIGIILPWLLHALRQDPAITSGPLATVLRDITSLLVYFAIASLFF